MGNQGTKSHNRSKQLSIGSNSRIPRWDGPGLPAPPGKPILIPGTEDSQPDVVGIRWERSPSNGGSAIVGYLVEHRRLGSPHWLRSTPALCTFPELTLSGLEPGWRYQFRVRAQNALGLSHPSEISDPLTVTLQRATACAPNFEQELQDTVALENEHTEFIVRFSGTPLPKISWFKDGFEIFSSRRTRIITENGKSVLLIHQTVLNDEGEIKCTATNRAGHVSTKARLTLEALPRIRLPRQYEDGLLFEQGETVRLKVSLAGKPPPTVIWYHDGDLIAQDNRHVFESMEGESTLKIPETTREDRGEYTVKAINKLGEDLSSFLVTVTGRPAAPGKATVAMTLGRSVTLSWKEPEDDGGCKIGTYIVEYYRIGWDVWLKAATSRQTTATLTELIEGSEYKFRVKAENPYGISDPSEESDVIFIPDLKRGITSPSLTGKSQSHREIHRSRGEKREVSFAEPPQRSRSLTREEAMSRSIESESHLDPSGRSASAQRLSISGSRVTFAPDTLILVDSEAPIPPARTKDHSKQNNYLGNHVNRASSVDKTIPQDIIQAKERPTSPTMIISPPTDDSSRRMIFRESRSRSRSLSMSRERSLSPLANIQENREEDNLAVPSRVSRPSMSLSVRKQETLYDETIEHITTRRSILIDDGLGSPTSPREDDENELRGSSEFMLVLYPEDQGQPQSYKRNIHEKGTIGVKRITSEETEEEEEEEDLVPPPMSLSLPELFSIDHQVIETLREAVSSTELLHERAMERFYRAVAAEEASEAAKRRTQLEKRIGELATSKAEEGSSRKEMESEFGSLDTRRPTLRRRLSNSGVTSQNLITSWQAKKNRRRSSEGQTEILHKSPIKLTLPLLPDVEARSDPNLPAELETSMNEPWRRSNDEEAVERLRRWHETNVPLVENPPQDKPAPWKDSTNKNPTETKEQTEDVQQNINKQQGTISQEAEEEEEEESIESSEESSEVSSADSEDLKLLKERILARQVMDEEDTYHPRGRPIPHVEPETPPISTHKAPLSPSTIVPKSILKKRTDDPVPLNSFGRPIPPEKPIRKIPPQPREEQSPQSDLTNANESGKPGVISESDTDSILNAAEAAKNRRIQAKMRSPTPEENEGADLEARMAMVNHYTEIVREYSGHHTPRATSEEKKPNNNSSSRISSDNQDQRHQMSPDRTKDRSPPRSTRKDTPESQFTQRTKTKEKSEKTPDRQTNQINQIDSKRNIVSSRGTTPARESKSKEVPRSRSTSRNQSPVSRSRNVSADRGGASSRSSSKTRTRATSQERTNRIPSRASSEEKRLTREKSIDHVARRSKPSSRTSSRASSRSSSRDRYRATTPVESKMERLQKALESKKYRSLVREAEMDGDYHRIISRDHVNGEQLAVEAQKTVRSMVGYVIDVSLLLAAVYVYVFKKEIWAIPFIALLLYRRVQQEIFGNVLKKWWPFNRKK